MRETPPIGDKYLLFKLLYKKFMSNVKMLSTWGQFAWNLKKVPSETKRSAFFSTDTLSNNTKFHEWLVGVVDGDGTFYFSRTNKGYWTFSFQVAQSTYNLRLLYYIKSKLKIGSISISKNMACYRIRNVQQLKNCIIPIFDKYPLLTSKYFNYNLFKKAIYIATDLSLSKAEKDYLISNLKVKKVPLGYTSPVWSLVNYSVISEKDAKKVITKSWLVGFTEAEGSFYIVKKGPKRLVHAFEITQKLDETVLQSIAYILKMNLTRKKTYLTVVSTNSKSMEYVVEYFFNEMKGMKALEYRIWSRSFCKKNKNYEYLIKIRNLMRKIRSIRFK
jgi:hypothetical protein